MTDEDRSLPNDWMQTTLGEIAELRLGRTPARKEASYWEPGKHPWVAIADLDNGPIWSTKELVSDIAWDEVLRGKVAPAGTLLLSFKLTIGKVGIVQMAAAHNEAIAAVLPDETVADRDFLFFKLQTLNYDRYKDAYVKGATLSKRKLEALPVSLPPLSEQRAIAHVLRIVRQAKEATDLVITASRELKKSLMRHLFRYGPVSMDESEKVALREFEFGLFPDTWRLRTIDELTTRLKAGGTPKRGVPRYWNGEIPFAKIEDVTSSWGVVEMTQESLTQAGLDESSAWLVPAGSVLLTMYATIGVPAINAIPMATNQAIIALRPGPNISADYLHRALEWYGPSMSRLNVQSTQKNISKRIVQAFPLPVPDSRTQSEIVASLDVLDHKIATEEAYREAVASLFGSLLHDLMTARIRVTDLEVAE